MLCDGGCADPENGMPMLGDDKRSVGRPPEEIGRKLLGIKIDHGLTVRGADGNEKRRLKLKC